ncbi:hypothetical protein MMC12_007186 [Toensbergia leucococca]|nr:hypothetical protein [Toensbergia leucococca]
MSAATAIPPAKIVDSVPKLQDLLNDLDSLPVHPPALYLDMEGKELGRDGSVSIMELLVIPSYQVYLIDIHTLGTTAFSTPDSTGRSLKSILESESVTKVFFDIRADSAALFNHYQVAIRGVHDLQLMELATRTYSKKFLSGLAKCIQQDSTMSAAEKSEWAATKDKGVRTRIGGGAMRFSTTVPWRRT